MVKIIVQAVGILHYSSSLSHDPLCYVRRRLVINNTRTLGSGCGITASGEIGTLF